MLKRRILVAALICSFALILLPYARAAGAADVGPKVGMKVSEQYVRQLARSAYFWGWPIANIYNRRLTFAEVPEPGLLGGIVPVGPLNRLSMLRDYIDPAERAVACPNQDVVYGATVLALDQDAAVVQVPDFGKRFWVYQVVDVRTDGFATLGSMYNTKPGFYLLVGPNWKGNVPAGIAGVFHSPSNTGMVIPRVFQNDTAADKKAIQDVISKIDVYPLKDFDGKVKIRDWGKLPAFKDESSGGKGETKWVTPDKFFDELPALLKDVGPMPGEEALYAQFSFLGELAKSDPKMRSIMIDEAKKTDSDMIDPLLQLSSFGIPLAHNWGTIDNGAAFGTDYYTRTAVARSNILVNKGVETKYFYLDYDANGKRLNGAQSYVVTFKGGGVPVLGFWSLSLYDKYHFFARNSLNRYSVGTKTANLKHDKDGSVTLYISPVSPGKDKESNWLPAPKGEDFSLYIRAYWPKPEVLNGNWTPPAVTAFK